LLPRIPPPHWRRCSSYLSVLMKINVSVEKSLEMRIGLQVGFGSADEVGKLPVVFAPDVLESEDSGSLFVNNSTKTGLALDNDIGNTHLTAESREEDNELNGVNIMGNDDKGGFLGLNESNDVVKTVLGEEGLLRVLRKATLVQKRE
jgi:hypothetical protein